MFLLESYRPSPACVRDVGPSSAPRPRVDVVALIKLLTRLARRAKPKKDLNLRVRFEPTNRIPEPSFDAGGYYLQAACYDRVPAFENNLPANTHHHLILFARPPDELDFRYEGVKRHIPPPAGVISLVPAGSPHRVRSSGSKDEVHIHLNPGLVGQVAT
jgi:hypothetical protein